LTTAGRQIIGKHRRMEAFTAQELYKKNREEEKYRKNVIAKNYIKYNLEYY
jgi:hypothetical protein